MQDEEIRELFHRMELRLERLDTKMDNLEKRLITTDGRIASLESRFDLRFAGLESRLDGKAGNWVVSLWGATLAMLIGAAFALTKWL